MRFVLPLRYVLPFALTASVAAPSLAAEEDRYGGDASTYDFSGFDKLPSSSSAVGGYRNSSPPSTGVAQPSTPLSSTALPSTAPPSSQPAPRPTQPSPSANDLRQPPVSQQPSSSAAFPPSTQSFTPSQPSQATPPGSSRPLSATQPSPTQPTTSRSSDPYASLPASMPTGYGASPSAQPPSATPSTTPSNAAGSYPPSSNDFRSYSQSTTGQSTAGQSTASQSTAGQSTGSPSNTFSQSSPPATKQPQQPAAQQPTGNASVLVSRVAGESDPLAASRERKTHEMLQKMLAPRPGSQLSGTPMSLASVVSSAESRDEQARRVEAYWALTSAAADYYLGLDEMVEMSRLRQQLPTYSNALGEAESGLKTRLDTSLKAARAAQYRLSNLMGGGVAPLPSDIPFTGPYATRMASVFPQGPPAEAALISELLPSRLAELQNAAADLAGSENWVDTVRGDQQNGSDGRGVVQALKLNALSRRAFVQIARDYNLQINRFSQLATPDRIDTGRLVAMLIRTTPTGAASADDALMAGFSAGSNNSANRTPSTSAPARR